MVDCTTNSYAHHRPIPPWTARTGRRDIARGRTYSRLGRGPGGVTDLHAARPTRGGHHCREVPRKDDTTATFSLRLERAKWAEIFFRLMDGILDMGLAVHSGAGGCAGWAGRIESKKYIHIYVSLYVYRYMYVHVPYVPYESVVL